MDNISILMPVKNPHEVFFPAAIQSVLLQSSPNWELIIVYDGDLPKTPDDFRISVLRNEGKLLSGALNTAMRASKCEFVCILLADDMLNPIAIETVHRYIKTCPKVDFFHSSRIIIDENNRHIGGIYKAKRKFTSRDFVNYGQAKHLLCWRRRNGLAIGGIDENLGLHGADDYDFPWSMVEAGNRFMAINECLYVYRQHSGWRLTTHVPLSVQIEELMKIFRKHKVSEYEIDLQIERRKAGYLRQAISK